MANVPALYAHDDDADEVPPDLPADLAAAAARYDTDAIRKIAQFHRDNGWGHLAGPLELTAYDIEVEKVRGRQARTMLAAAQPLKPIHGKVTEGKIAELFRRAMIPCRVRQSGHLYEGGAVPGFFVVLPTDGVDEEGTAARATAWLRPALPDTAFRVQFRNWASYPAIDLGEMLPTGPVGYALATP